jgi:hypothetical protein
MEQALEVRTPIWGIGGGGAHHGGLAAAMQVGSGEPATAGRKRGGEHRLRVHGAAVSSGGGHCGDGGAHRWPEVALDGKVVSATEGGGRLGASTVSCGGLWLSGLLAWLRGAREWCGVVGASALGAEEHDNERAEADGVSRAEWATFGGCHRKRRDDFSHGPTVRRGETRGGDWMRHMWKGHGGQLVASARGGASGYAAITCARCQHPGTS